MDRILDLYRMQAEENPYLFWVKEVVVAAVIFFVFWLCSKLLRRILGSWGARITAFTATDLDDRILRRITPNVSQLVVFAGLYFSVRSLPLPGNVHVIVSGIIFIINIIILTVISCQAADELLHWYAGRLAAVETGLLSRQLIPLVEKVMSIFLITTALIITLKHFNYDILSLVTALGIGSLAIGMAAKDTLANMISGFTIMLDRPFRIGDRIKPGGDQTGDVVDIGLRSTKIKTLDNTFLIIPNSTLCNGNLVNMSLPDIKGSGRINVGVAYGSDIDNIKRLLVEAALDVSEVMRDPAPGAFFTSFGESALNMALIFWVDDTNKIFSVTDQINMRIMRRFQEEGVVIPFPTHRVLVEKES